jgi:uncharacterized protein (AIM24 family)
MSTDENDDVLKDLLSLEHNKLAEYCHEIELRGEIAQIASIRLKKSQNLWVSKGCLMGHSPGISWQLKVPGGAGKAVGRMLSGEGAALTYVTANEDNEWLCLTANQPGKLATWDLSKGSIVCTRGAFVAGIGDVDINVTTARSAGAALFGGAGLFLQRISGTGIAIVHGSGDFVEKSLAEGEKLLVSTGNLAVFSASVKYGVRGVGGCTKKLFGGEGLFMTELTGPGWVMLQSLKKMPAQRGSTGQ